ncbi:hypothetical protein LPJ53_005819, partial [Coemansia erecta]
MPPPARPTLPLPTLTLLSQNLHGAGTGGQAYVARHNPTAEPGENRFRESAARTAKLAWLLDRLRLTAPGPTMIGFIQEFNSVDNPENILTRRFREYHTIAGRPGSANDIQRPVADESSSRQRTAAALKFDTAVLVHKSLGTVELIPAASCPRATFVIVPSRGLLLVSVHGPFRKGVTNAASDFYRFHQSIIDAAHRFMEAGWTPLIAGDFNFAPFPGDRASRSDRASESDCLWTIPGYEAALDLVDYANYAAPPSASGIPYSPSNPCRSLFTHRATRHLNDGSAVTYHNSRIDLFLVPTGLATRQGVEYDVDGAPCTERKSLPPDDCADPVLAPTISAILARFGVAGFFSRPDSAEHFAYYARLLTDITEAAQAHHKRGLYALDRRLRRLYKQHARLANEHRGAGRHIHREPLDALELAALELAEKHVSINRLKAASVWLRHGDRNTRWQAAATKCNLAPRQANHITCLLNHLPSEYRTDAARATDPEAIQAVTHRYYAAMYDASSPDSARLTDLLWQHHLDVHGDTAEHSEAPEAPPSSSELYTLAEITATCKRAGRRKATGPNNVPAELYIL